MQRKKISMSVPQDVLYELNALSTRSESIEEKLKINLAIGFFASNDISVAKAAQLAGKSISEFMDMLKSINLPVVDYTEEMLDDDLQFIKEHSALGIKKEDLHNLIDHLNETDRKTALDFLMYLVERSGKKPSAWEVIDNAPADEEPLTEEEKRQLESNTGYVTWEEGRRELGLPSDI